MKSLMKWIMVSTAMISTNAMAEETTLCTVNDTSGTDLNVRASAPNGPVVGKYWNGAKVRVLEVRFFESFGQSKPWALLANNTGGTVGWVYFPYIMCPRNVLASLNILAPPPPSPNPAPSTTPSVPGIYVNSNDKKFDKIFSYKMYDNVYGITFLGGFPKDEKTSEMFKEKVLALLRDGKLISTIQLYSPGGNSGEAMKIAEQIRTLRARAKSPWVAPDGATRICQLDPKITDEGKTQDGPLGRLVYNPDTGEGDSRCECASACTLAWAGGVGREGGVIGVHRYGHWEPDKFAWYSTEEAQRYYERVVEYEKWLRTMGASDSFIKLVKATPNFKVRYLTKSELEEMNNFPPFLEELMHARCGDSPDTSASEVEKVKFRGCRKDIIKEDYKNGAKDYLAKYGSTN
jgi:hypothetical protein